MEETLNSQKDSSRGQTSRTDKRADVISQLEDKCLINVIFEKLMSSDFPNDKKDFFDVLDQAIEQIYGVESETVHTAQKRFMVANATCPPNFEEKLTRNQGFFALERLLKQVNAYKTDSQREKDTTRAIFLLTPEKLRKHNLVELNKMLNYYAIKLLASKQDPFMEMQHRASNHQLENDDLFNLINKFKQFKKWNSSANEKESFSHMLQQSQCTDQFIKTFHLRANLDEKELKSKQNDLLKQINTYKQNFKDKNTFDCSRDQQQKQKTKKILTQRSSSTLNDIGVDLNSNKIKNLDDHAV